MNREQARKWFQSHMTSDPMVNEAYDMAIEALTEPINCVKCKHYYETEDDTDVHGHCKMDTAHTNLIGKEEAIERLKQNKAAAEFYAGMVQNTNAIENELKDIEAIDMAIEALSVANLKEEFESATPNCQKCAIKQLWQATEKEDLVSVVRCKDCKYKRLYDEYDEGETKYYYCALEDRPNRNWSVDDTDYCSWGERRSDE